jgi:hypothetical protein
MAGEPSLYASRLRLELNARNRRYAQGRLSVESYGNPQVIVYEPDGELHGNFHEPAWRAICSRPEWMRRFDKVHAQAARSLPKPTHDPARRWKELDSSTSSDALLMNVFCTPGVAEALAVRKMLGVDGSQAPEFGWKARVPLKSGRFDRTEVDMRWGGLLVEAKLTESDFQTCKSEVVEAYRDFAEVFDRERLPPVEIRMVRRRDAVELVEEFTQEWEPKADDDGEAARAFQAEIVARADELQPRASGYASYQLIRNVLAAHAQDESFCVIHDARRPDLREAWFEVMAAVKSAELRVRLKVLTWQELAAVLPENLQAFLDVKYGVVAPGKVSATVVDEIE